FLDATYCKARVDHRVVSQAVVLAGVQLVISDAHAGLKHASEAVIIGAAWQRCRVPFLRNMLAQVPKGHAEMVAAALRTLFAQPDAEPVRSQIDVIAGMLGGQFPKVEAMLRGAAEEITAFAEFPVSHWRKIWSTDENVNRPTTEDGCSGLFLVPSVAA